MEATLVSQIAAISAAISAILACLGLIYAGYQFRQNTVVNRQRMYLESCDRYYELRRMTIEDPELTLVHSQECNPAELTTKQHYHICTLLAFCEGLYLTRQIDIFPEILGGSWRNFIKHTLEAPAVRHVWDEETKDKATSDFSEDFISFVTQLLAC